MHAIRRVFCTLLPLFVIYFCYLHSLLRFLRFVIPLPFLSSSNTDTAILPISTHKSRALLSIENSLAETKRGDHALMTVSTGLTNYNMDAVLKPKKTVVRPKMIRGFASHTCLCPNRNDSSADSSGGSGRQNFNKTLFKR